MIDTTHLTNGYKFIEIHSTYFIIILSYEVFNVCKYLYNKNNSGLKWEQSLYKRNNWWNNYPHEKNVRSHVTSIHEGQLIMCLPSVSIESDIQKQFVEEFRRISRKVK